MTPSTAPLFASSPAVSGHASIPLPPVPLGHDSTRNPPGAASLISTGSKQQTDGRAAAVPPGGLRLTQIRTDYLVYKACCCGGIQWESEKEQEAPAHQHQNRKWAQITSSHRWNFTPNPLQLLLFRTRSRSHHPSGSTDPT